MAWVVGGLANLSGRTAPTAAVASSVSGAVARHPLDRRPDGPGAGVAEPPG